MTIPNLNKLSHITRAELSNLSFLGLHHILTMSLNKLLLQVQFHLQNKLPSVVHSMTQTCSMMDNNL
jgi:hypothetical protein